MDCVFTTLNVQILSLEHELFLHKIIIYCVSNNQASRVHQAGR